MKRIDTVAIPEGLILATAAAAILGTDVYTVARLARSGKLPVAVQLPGKRGARMFRPADVEALRDEQAEEKAS